MEYVIQYKVENSQLEDLCQQWRNFLQEQSFSQPGIQIIFKDEYPIVQDQEGRRFQINFDDKSNYHKHKSNIASEPLSRALGSGKIGRNVLDLSAGLCIDAIFLIQLGFEVTAVERNPLVYLCLRQALILWNSPLKNHLKIIYGHASSVLNDNSCQFELAYFDPMFPSKKKSALPRQEMVIFKNIVGFDEDAGDVLNQLIQMKKFKRVVVKRPLSAEPLDSKWSPSGHIKGKVIRYDIYSY